MEHSTVSHFVNHIVERFDRVSLTHCIGQHWDFVAHFWLCLPLSSTALKHTRVMLTLEMKSFMKFLKQITTRAEKYYSSAYHM